MSLLPPRTRAKLDRLPMSEKREYAQTLKGRYEVRCNSLKITARQIAKEWALQQEDHFERIIAELDAVIND